MARVSMLGLVLGLVATTVGAIPTPASASEFYPMVFPVDGENRYRDTWGAPRSGVRTHEGTDILADKMVPVLAAADGTVGWIHDEVGGNCCAMALEHDDGWSSWYIHLNNDTPGTDDGLGWGFAEGIEQGARVTAGQLIAYVGDSGNAEWTSSHLHFELHQPDGTKVNPYPHLVNAEAGPPPPTEPAIVMFDPISGMWHTRHEDGSVVSLEFGAAGDQPLLGDWDCDGTATPGGYDPTTGLVSLSNTESGPVEAEYVIAGEDGETEEIALVGDFNGDGCDTVSLYRQTRGLVSIVNSVGHDGGSLVPDYQYYFGIPGDKPFVGDFDGNGMDTVGLHREANGFVYMRHSHTIGFADNEFWYGIGGDRLLASDWIGQGYDTVAIFRPSESRLYFRFSNDLGFADAQYEFGGPDWIPVAAP
jgi:hypothetical protein